jgi:hypothetical protein
MVPLSCIHGSADCLPYMSEPSSCRSYCRALAQRSDVTLAQAPLRVSTLTVHPVRPQRVP